MIVKVTYDDQRLDVFDTSAFTSAAPFGKSNILTNFEIRFDTIGDGGLWMAAHSYQADKPPQGAESETPVARRKRGWMFLLADASELEHVELVVVDGEAIMKRVFGELVDLQAFDEAAYECIGSSSKGLHARIADLFGYLRRMTGSERPAIPGIPETVVDAVLASLEAEGAASEREEDEKAEEWGDMDEAGW